MAIAFVKNVGSAGNGNATSVAVTVPAAGVAAGDILMVRGTANGGARVISSIADTQSNTYTKIVDSNPGGDCVSLWKCLVGVALVSGNTITVTFSTKAGISVVIDQFSGLANTADGQTTTVNAATTLPTASITPTNAADLIYAALSIKGTANTISVEDADNAGGDTWHVLTASTAGTSDRNHGVYKITTSAVTQTYNPTISASTDVDEALASLQAAGGGGATGQPTMARWGAVPGLTPGPQRLGRGW